MAKLHITSELDNLAKARQFVEETAGSFTDDADAVSDVILAMDEALTNVMMHGYQGTDGIIEIEVTSREGALVLYLRDQAPTFDPTHAAAPDINAPLSQRTPGGLGVYMMHRLTDELRYRTTPEGINELTLVKRVAK